MLLFGAVDPDGAPGLEEGTLQFDGTASEAVNLTRLTETEKVVDWWTVSLASSDGVGDVYAGTFAAEGSPWGTPVSVTGSFSACHVGNL